MNATKTNAKTCRKCGDSFLGKQCLSCARVRHAVYYALNAVKINARIEALRKAYPEKLASRRARWRKANPEIVAATRERNKENNAASVAAWQARNPERVAANGVAYRAANKEKCKAAISAWAKANPEARLIYRENRRAKENGRKLSTDLPKKLFELQRGRCACCKSDLKKTKYHLDHKMPLSKGGANDDPNIQLLCPTCNSEKGAKHPIDFMQQKGFLL